MQSGWLADPRARSWPCRGRRAPMRRLEKGWDIRELVNCLLPMSNKTPHMCHCWATNTLHIRYRIAFTGMGADICASSIC